MLNYNEIKERKYILVDDEPYEVVAAQVSRKQANKPVNKTKLKSLMNGRVFEHTFHMSDKVHEADMSKKNYIYIYSKGDEFWFHAEGDKSDRFTMNNETIGNAVDYISEKDSVEFSIFTNNDDEEVITGVNLPIKMELEVTEAPPAIKGNTATGGDKLATVKTGLKVTVPLFINIGDVIAVNTDTGTYSERVSKA
jgi:elongation factor P